MEESAQEQRPILGEVLANAWPIMMSYVPVGMACGILGSKCGVGPIQGFLLSVTVISGGSQFMISNLWLAGMPAATIIACVGAISLRFALYSASLAPYLQKCRKREALALAFTLIEEAYGVTLSKWIEGEKCGWTIRHALLLNLLTIATWAGSVTAGGALGAVLQIPTAVAGFAMTALFIYLLWSQLDGQCKEKYMAASAAVLAVIICKLVGLSAIVVPAGSFAGVVTAILYSKRPGGSGDERPKPPAEPGEAGEQVAPAVPATAPEGGDAQ